MEDVIALVKALDAEPGDIRGSGMSAGASAIWCWLETRSVPGASDTKLPSVSVKLTASSRGDKSGSSRARSTIAVQVSSGILVPDPPAPGPAVPQTLAPAVRNVERGIPIDARVRQTDSVDYSTA